MGDKEKIISEINKIKEKIKEIKKLILEQEKELDDME